MWSFETRTGGKPAYDIPEHREWTRFHTAVVDASLYWTGEDEDDCPALRYLRTMAGLFFGTYGIPFRRESGFSEPNLPEDDPMEDR